MTVPTLNVAGWWDQEDFYGPLKIYETLEKHDTREPELPRRRPVEPRRLERRPGGQKLGKIDFGSPTGEVLPREHRGAVLRPPPQGQGAAPPARGHGLRVGQQPLAHLLELAAARGRDAGALLPRRRQALVHAARGRRGIHGFDSYVCDPAHPVPYRPRPIEPTYYPRARAGTPGCPRISASSHARPDVLSWETEPLDRGRRARRRDHRASSSPAPPGTTPTGS